MKKHDLSLKFLGRVDNHLARKLVDHLESNNVYSKEITESLKKKISIKPKEVNMEDLESKSKVLLDIVRDEATSDELITAGNFNSSYLAANFDVTEDDIEAFFQYARALYDEELYSDTNLILFYYRAICPKQSKLISCYFGKIAAQLLTTATTESAQQCLADIQMLHKLIDERHEKTQSSHTLEMRLWLLHSSLFLFFKKDFEVDAENNGVSAFDMSMNLLNALIDLFCDEKSLQAIQMSAQWLLRYLTVAAVLTRARRSRMRPILRAVRQEQYQYTDPFTTFLFSLLQEADFEGALAALKECETLLESDFFLKPFKEQFLSNARSMFFQTYSRVYSSIDIDWLTAKCGIAKDKAESWVVNMIRTANLEARIDSEKGKVFMKHKIPNPYQQTIDLTKDLAFRTYRLVSELS